MNTTQYNDLYLFQTTNNIVCASSQHSGMQAQMLRSIQLLTLVTAGYL